MADESKLVWYTVELDVGTFKLAEVVGELSVPQVLVANEMYQIQGVAFVNGPDDLQWINPPNIKSDDLAEVPGWVLKYTWKPLEEKIKEMFGLWNENTLSRIGK